jgi:Protein of unknown function (DUF1566)
MSLLVATAACGHGNDASGGPPRAAPADRLVAAGDGVVRDSWTGLEWTSRDHDVSLPWEEAARHCRELSRGGRGDWRLPEIGELQALYDARSDEPCGDMRCHLDPAIRLDGPFVWSASARGPGTRFYFDFTSATSLSPGIAPRLVRRVLCVRQP